MLIMNEISFKELAKDISGELYFDDSALHKAQKMIYATDASVYQEQPMAVAIPKTKQDVISLIQFANKYHISLIPRAAGTSLAGQVVGHGLVVDISKYFKEIVELNVEQKWVKVQPGIIRDDLNVFLKPYGLMFAPETSTSNRALVGGMIGNNSCGLHSIVWGDTRRHLLEATVLLSDGSEVVFSNKKNDEVDSMSLQRDLEGTIYCKLKDILENPIHQNSIESHYPKKELTRRNTGYALDILLDEYKNSKGGINLCQLLAGSEGTLAFIAEAKLNLLSLPPKQVALICLHFTSLSEALHANSVIVNHSPMASELVDKYIMDFTKNHPTYQHNRFFIQGDPEAILMVEFMEHSEDELNLKCKQLIEELEEKHLGYAYPIIKGEKMTLAWDVRKAGLGLIRNMPGDEQPVNLIEDCAVTPQDLPDYIEDLQAIFKTHSLHASYYAHAGAGELHVEPLINLKTQAGQKLFRTVLQDTTVLIKKYNGSLSGEHGDGRLRGEFIPHVLGQEVYQLLQEVKNIFDPQGVFNANKIVNTPPMNEYLRYSLPYQPAQFETYYSFDNPGSMLRLAEKCSGSGDCRRSHLSGGTMCPSYMATLQEKDSTRARANILRQFLSNCQAANPFNHPEIKEVLDLCLSCKACKTECPSGVDVAKMKAEFLQHYYDAHAVPFRTWLIGNFTKTQQVAILVPGVYNAIVKNSFISGIIKRLIGFAPKRSLPQVGKQSLKSWWRRNRKTEVEAKTVYLFCDEFTNYNDVEIGIKAIQLLANLGYNVVIPNHKESGRTYLSKGMVKRAKRLIESNVSILSPIVSEEKPLIGIEPSAIITFRDEALDLTTGQALVNAKYLSGHSLLIEEFILKEFEKGNISSEQFTENSRQIKLHGHCYQKAFHAVDAVAQVLSIPKNYEVAVIPSGCCGMAGSFGFEKEHYEVSMKVGELVLLPEVRKQQETVIIAASGTSCRHQIKDGTQRKAMHPVEILWEAVRK